MSAADKLLIEAGAKFSDCRKYRYALWRVWDHSQPSVMFIGLNPSTATENKADPTITRVINFAESWGYGGIYVLNLHPFVTAYPEELKQCGLAEQKINDGWLQIYGGAQNVKKVVFAWGAFKGARDQAARVMNMFPEAWVLGINKDGSPKHPLYIKGDTPLILYTKKS